MRLLAAMVFWGAAVYGQTPVNKSVPVAAGQRVHLHFDYPEIVRISTWDKPEVSITGTVQINGGENDEAFVLESSVTGTAVTIKNEIKNFKNLPKRITIMRDGQKITFLNNAAYQKYCAENGRDFGWQNYGVDLEISLVVKVPRGASTKVEAVYGIVEVSDFAAPLEVDATYGGIDATVAEAAVGELIAETNYGQIYSNLAAALKGTASGDFHTQVAAKPGTGPRHVFESKYGNVYLRKEK